MPFRGYCTAAARRAERAKPASPPRRPRIRDRRHIPHARAAQRRRTGLAVADCLVREGPARTQVGRDRAEGLAGVHGTIVVRAGAEVPRRAILVDDVVTTGATVAAGAAALRGAGVGDVAAVAYARTPGR